MILCCEELWDAKPMIAAINDWLTPMVHWLSQWMPEATAALVVYGILAGMLCFAVGIPLSEAWAIAHRRWWLHTSKTERRLLLLFLVASLVLYTPGAAAGIPNLITWSIAPLAAAVLVALYSVVSKGRFATTSADWETRSETMPGFPVISWFQEIDTGAQGKHVRNEFELNAMFVNLTNVHVGLRVARQLDN
jgi:hypothetical protein